MTTQILPDMIPMRDIKQVVSGDRLFYELGHKRILGGEYGDNWIGEGKFKEIEDALAFIESDVNLSNREYLEHHNFMIIKKQN